MEIVLFCIAGVLSLMGYKKYFSHLQCVGERNPFPWVIWTLAGLDVVINVWMSDNSSWLELVANSIYVVAPLSIAVLLIKKGGFEKISNMEKGFAAVPLLVLAVIVSMRYTGFLPENSREVVLTWMVLGLEGIIVLQLFLEIREDVQNEEKSPWVYWSFSGAIALIGLWVNQMQHGVMMSFSGSAVIVFYLIVTTGISLYIHLRQSWKIHHHPSTKKPGGVIPQVFTYKNFKN